MLLFAWNMNVADLQGAAVSCAWATFAVALDGSVHSHWRTAQQLVHFAVFISLSALWVLGVWGVDWSTRHALIAAHMG